VVLALPLQADSISNSDIIFVLVACRHTDDRETGLARKRSSGGYDGRSTVGNPYRVVQGEAT
jgi:hypothetical protein